MKNPKTIFDLTQKTILITGAQGWLAGGFIEPLLTFGARLILLDSNPQIEKTAAGLGKRFKGRVVTRVVDMFDREAYRKVLKDLSRGYAVSGVINNAFFFGKSNVETGGEGDFMALTPEQWSAAFESGIIWAVETTKPFLPSMRMKKNGSILNVCSMYSLIAPNPGLYEGPFKKYLSQPTYTAVKSGLWGWTKYMSSFLAADQVRCNAIAPGAFSKPSTDPKFIKRLNDTIPMKRIGTPGDLAGAVVYLMSDASSYMTGQCLTIDGGWTVR